jgi:hypothetical protein
LLDSAVSLFEPRFAQRALRTLPLIRKKLDLKTLKHVLDAAYPDSNLHYASCTRSAEHHADSPQKAVLLSLLPDEDVSMEVDEIAPTTKPNKKAPTDILPEADIYTTLIVLVYLLDHHHVEQVGSCTGEPFANLIAVFLPGTGIGIVRSHGFKAAKHESKDFGSTGLSNLLLLLSVPRIALPRLFGFYQAYPASSSTNRFLAT